ncbi:hypothetical protein D8B26_001518 [Coccidioides posadasii str. Silveira]|uniref:Uncharacterized protein n=2 Tax=Coccidioides posadasii TaxID=199306 RepID=E9CVH7_COCPS|nr:hypothetical protein CPC735_047830 [Coccidioides posadasii C735 delta SOWgp]EER23413.1 hypothetical protein CPC735_047830 [Coccidioides posadasii C735 delta SOWgp]EFW21303.1 conserved hypothetical protein [Coccidioides posadasii str. Silveira]QVM06813.1 hypothetical protein D8B26_001518 [Coccidioides posadasii str. Silveira]|eukprot:XP_003065558.1 hypothetical protein CPC735_047830 [Coccidioides posadasii C735 delta SOWgp]
MAPSTINVLLSSFPGLSLPSTLSIPISSISTVADLTERIDSRLPASLSLQSPSLVLTTTDSTELGPYSSDKLANFLTESVDGPSTFLPVRLSVRVYGGKGGFGSQLRAAGGRMSSRRKGAQGEDNGSNRNLDGRRLRTVKEAKALAEYLALKPEMERKEKEARRKRWEMIVELAEKREAEIRNGDGKGKVDGEWMEDKEEAGEKAREAVLRAMKEGIWKDNLAGSLLAGSSTSPGESSGSGGSVSASEDSEMEDVGSESHMEIGNGSKASRPARRFIGFDDDDDDEEFLSDENEDKEPSNNDSDDSAGVKGKGKAKA